MAAAIIENLALNSENRTRFYRAELRGVSALVSRETAEAAAAAPDGAIKLPGTTVANAQSLSSHGLGKPGMWGTMGPPLGVHPRDISPARDASPSPGGGGRDSTPLTPGGGRKKSRFAMPEWYQQRALNAIVSKASTGKMLLPREMALLKAGAVYEYILTPQFTRALISLFYRSPPVTKHAFTLVKPYIERIPACV